MFSSGFFETHLKFTSFIFLISLSLNSIFAQDVIKGTHYRHFQLTSKKDTIDFVVSDTNLAQQKPILLFCQGSQPVPLFLDLKERGIFPVTLNNFDIDSLNEKFHVVVISMPKTPLIAASDHLNRQYCYVSDTSQQNSYRKDYLLADYFENYIARANAVIKFLRKQSWVDKNELIVAGHSQGARIAVGIAESNNNVTRLGLFGYNPLGRMDQLIRQARKDAESGKISWEVADSITNAQYNFLEFVQNEDSVAAHPSLVSWRSFSVGTLEKLLKLKIPIYIAYGSEDIIADFCDLLPLYFIQHGISDYSVKRYTGLEHNFFPLDDSGRADHANGQWKGVMNEFLRWSGTESQ